MKNLLSKWLDRKGPKANKIRKYLKLTPKDYRKLLVEGSQTIEQQLCSKHFEDIVYEHVPSVAMNKYRTSFYRNDAERFKGYIDRVKQGVSKMCATAIYPYQLYDAFLKSQSEDNTKAIEAQWYSLPNYMGDTKRKLLPMIDTSGSMAYYDALPSRVAWSLGVYISERNEGIFKDAFLTFATNSKLLYLQGSIAERFRTLSRAPWNGSTNLESAFNLLLSKAIENRLTQEDMPDSILILSDMQFNPSITNYKHTSLEMIKDAYDKAGYVLPTIIYWNLRAEKDNVTAGAFDENVVLISGFSPSCLKSILSGDNIQSEKPVKETPYDVMMKVINSERYEPVSI